MNKRKKTKRKYIIVALVSAVLVFTCFSVFISHGKTKIEQIFADSFNTVEYYVIKKPIEFVSDLFTEYNSLKDVYSENQTLKKKLDEYASVQANTDVLAEEINKLKKSQGLSYLPSEYETKNASVITRDAGTWSQQITISIGSKSNIKEGMVVVNSKGMIGTVKSVTNVTSTVQLLTTPNPTSQLPVMILNGTETVYGLLNTYNASSSRYELTLLTNISKLDKNAKVYTSGLGGQGQAPKGIYLGKASKIVDSSSGSGKIVYVKPAANFDDLSYVTVVLKVNGNE